MGRRLFKFLFLSLCKYLRRESPNGEKTMNGLVIVLIAIVVLGAGYLLYGRWLASKWGLDPKAKTPAYTHEDGQDYVPSSKLTVFAHQFSSIAGAGPVTGPILASVFGWVPVLLWLLIGVLFFGAVQDFGALYASVKNEGKSMGMIIEKYIGRTGRKLFMLFCWLFTLLVMAAFTDMVAGTFVGKGVEGMTKATGYANSAAASISMLFIVVAIIFGLIQKKVGKMKEWVRAVVAIALLVVMFIIGLNQGAQPILGFNYGARKFDRMFLALKKTAVAATLVSTAGFILGTFFPHALASLFTRDEELKELAARALRISVTVFPLIGSQIVITNFFQSIGKAKISMTLSLTRQVLFLIPCLIFLPPIYGLDGVWCSMPVADSLSVIVSTSTLVYFIRKFKKRQNSAFI